MGITLHRDGLVIFDSSIGEFHLVQAGSPFDVHFYGFATQYGNVVICKCCQIGD